MAEFVNATGDHRSVKFHVRNATCAGGKTTNRRVGLVGGAQDITRIVQTAAGPDCQKTASAERHARSKSVCLCFLAPLLLSRRLDMGSTPKVSGAAGAPSS